MPILRGSAALQVHGIGTKRNEEGVQVRWRNLRIIEVTAAENALLSPEKLPT